MTDKELLEAAAKAAGIELQRSRLDDPLFGDMLLKVRDPRRDGRGVGWNPLKNSGDALELAIKLGLAVVPYVADVAALHNSSGRSWAELRGADTYAATRRAIVRAAAAMEKP